MIEAEKLPVVYKTEDFKRIVLEFVYTIPREDNNSLYGSLLLQLISNKSKNYDTEEDLANALIKNYVMNFSISKGIRGNNVCFKYHIEIPDPTILKDSEYNTQDTLNFLMDIIYNPYAKDNSFYEEETDRAKSKLKLGLEKDFQNITSYASIRINELIDDTNYYEDEIHRNILEIKDINEKDLFNFYKRVIQTKRPFIFILGNVSEEFEEMVANSFSNDLIACQMNTNYMYPFVCKNTPKLVEESKEYSQSIVKMAYKVKDYTYDDILKLTLFNYILSSQASNLLHHYLRTRENLVYTSSSSCFFDNGVLIITALISAQNKERTIKTIKEIMDKVLDEEFLRERLENVKSRKRVYLERLKDDKNVLIGEMYDKYVKYRATLLEDYEVLKKYTVQDLITFLKRLELDTVYYLEGKIDEA